MIHELSPFDLAAEKLSELRSLIVVSEQADFSAFDERARDCYFLLMVDLVNKCEDLFFNLDRDSHNKIKELEKRIEEQQKELEAAQESIKKAGGGL